MEVQRKIGTVRYQEGVCGMCVHEWKRERERERERELISNTKVNVVETTRAYIVIWGHAYNIEVD